MEEIDYDWTDEMIECKVEERTKPDPKFKVGDRVKWFNHTCNITSIATNENTYTYLIKHNDYREDKTFAKWVPESELTFDGDEEMKSENELFDEYEELTDRAFKGGYEKCKSDIELNGFQLPDGYIFKDENGNVINATKIVLEKKPKKSKKSPKTDDIIKWLRERDMTKYIGVIYSGMCSITFDTEKLIKDITEMIGDE